jgi:anti-sigma factor RsiW
MAGLSAWVDGELVGEEAATLAAHVTACAACERRRAVLSAVGEAVRTLPPEGVSADFDATLRRRGATRRFPAMRAAALAAASLAAALVTIWWVTPGRSVRPETGAQTAAFFERTAHALAADCGLGSSTGSCRVETPCASAAECGRTLDIVWGPRVGQAPAMVVGPGVPGGSR